MPGVRPAIPHFSSGPCAKRPGWSLQALTDAALGRSHRAKLGKAKLKRAIDLTREILASPRRLPHRHRAGVRYRRGRDGAVVAARRAARHHAGLGILRRRLGQRRPERAEAQGRSPSSRRPTANCPISPRSTGRPTWSSPGTARPRACASRTATGSRPTGRASRSATPPRRRSPSGSIGPSSMSSTFSWQKALGGEAAHGMLILSPRAVARLESYTPAWPLPKIFRMTKGGKLNEAHLRGRDHQHAVDAVRRGLSRCARLGEVDRRARCADRARRRQHQGDRRLGQAHALGRFPRARSGDALQHLGLPQGRRSGGDQACRRCAGGVRQEPRRRWSRRKAPATISRYYRDAPPGLRIWCGATVEASDVEALTAWLDWAFARTKDALPKAA